MALRLFRTTGHSTLLQVGEARAGLHPLPVVLALSAWIGIACNTGLWHLLLQDGGSVRHAIAATALLAGASGLVLSLLAWRNTLKPAATLLLLAGAVIACGLWVQQLPVDALWSQRPRNLLPNWAAFLRGPVLLMMLVLAVAPIVWVWQLHLRRLTAHQQLRATAWGALVAVAAIAAGALLLLAG